MEDEPKEVEPIVEEKPQKKSKVPTFARPPMSDELFTAEFKRKFDQAPGWGRHFVEKFIQTGSLELAAKQSNITLKDIDPTNASKRQFAELLDSHGLSNEDLIVYLHDCVKADTLVRDKHGKLHKVTDLKVRLQALEMIFKLKGSYTEKKKSQPPTEELFGDVDLESKD